MPSQNGINNRITDNDFTVTNTDAGGNAFISVSNLSSAASSNAVLEAEVAAGTAGDAYVNLFINAGTEWSLGLDNSDSDAFVISANATLGTNNVLRAATTGNVSITLGNLDVTKSASGADVSITVSNTSNTASSTASEYITVAGGTAGDAVTQYAVSGVTTWTQGIDNSDSDAYVVAASNALGTSNAFKITTAGAPTFPLAPLNVASGGTGDSSLTAYAVLCGGTTSTGAVQSIAGVGTSGQVLVSNGAGALPTFQSISATNAFDKVTIQTFTSNGTYTPTSGMKYCTIEVVGGGGGGGGSITTGASQVSGGAGGGGGGYARKTVTAATIGASQTVTVGAQGSSGTTGGGTGGTGGTTSVGSIVSATGGAGGTASGGGSFLATGGVSGVGSSGDINVAGIPGLWAYGVYPIAWSGAGGSSIYGGGGIGVVGGTIAQNGADGYTYGGGGSGAYCYQNTTASPGGHGASGLVIITEYVSS